MRLTALGRSSSRSLFPCDHAPAAKVALGLQSLGSATYRRTFCLIHKDAVICILSTNGSSDACQLLVLQRSEQPRLSDEVRGR